MERGGPAAPIARLMAELTKLPGIGPKTAARLTYHLLRRSMEEAKALAEAVVALKSDTVLCSRCQNITQTDPCPLCSSGERDRGIILVVEEPLDILAFERTGRYKGLYHVLHGVLSPLNGVGPDDLKVKELVARLKEGGVREVILATNPNLEGETTALYLHRLLMPLGVKVTHLARGLAVGADLEYVDDVTLTQALEGRREY